MWRGRVLTEKEMEDGSRREGEMGPGGEWGAGAWRGWGGYPMPVRFFLFAHMCA